MTLFINNLPYQVTQTDLLEFFAEYGAVKHIFFPTDWKTGQNFGFAFIEMSVRAAEEAAQLALNNFELMGHQLQISEVSSQEYTHNSGSKTVISEF